MHLTLEPETVAAICKLDPKCVDMASTRLGMSAGEPLLVGMNALLRYAKAYKARFEQPLADDGILGDCWLTAIDGLHGLMDGDGAVAMERGITTDSKSNGVLESVYWAARNVAGFVDTTEVVK